MFNNTTNSGPSFPLASYEYFELVELLVFQISLPSKGLSIAHKVLQELPLHKKIRAKFENRLKDIRNMAVADVVLSNDKEDQAEKIEEKLQFKPEVEQEKSVEQAPVEVANAPLKFSFV